MFEIKLHARFIRILSNKWAADRSQGRGTLIGVFEIALDGMRIDAIEQSDWKPSTKLVSFSTVKKAIEAYIKAPPEKLGMPVAMSPGMLQQTNCVRGSGSDFLQGKP